MGNAVPTQEEKVEPLKSSEELMDLYMEDVEELYKAYKDICEGFSVNMTEYVQIFQERGIDSSPGHGEDTFAIWDTDKNSLIDALEFFTGITLFAGVPPADKISFLFKVFDFNAVGSISLADVECLFTYGVTSTCKMHGIDLEQVNFSVIKKRVLGDLVSDSRISLKCFTKLCNHRLVVEFLRMFRIPELRLVPLTKLNFTIDILNLYPAELVCLPSPSYIPVYTSLNTKRYKNYRTWLSKVIIPNLRNKCEKRGETNFAATLSLDWIYGISHTTTPAIQYLVHNPDLENHAVLYTAGAAVVLYNFYTHEQKYYLQHKNRPTALAVSSKGNLAASAEYNKKRIVIHVWDTRTLANIVCIKIIQKGPVLCMEFAFSDKYLLVLGKDKPHALLIYEWRQKLLEVTSIMKETPLAIEKVQDSDALCIVTKEKLIELKLEKGLPTFKDYCVISKQEKARQIACGTLIGLRNGQLAGVTGQEDGNVWYWERSDRPPKGLIDYECPIVAIKRLEKYTAIATSVGRVFIWDIPNGCIRSIDLENIGVNLISTNILHVDTHGNNMMIATVKDVVNLALKEDRTIAVERLHKIINVPGVTQNAVAVIKGPTGKQKAIAIAGDIGVVAVIDTDANEFCTAIQIGEVVTVLDSNTTEKFGCSLVAGTVKGNVFFSNNFFEEDSSCVSLACLKSKVVDLKISPNGLCIVAILEDHSCVLFERKEDTFENTCLRKLEKEGPIYPISLAFSQDSLSFIAYSNKSTVFILETKGLNLKVITLAELKEQEWINNNSKYPLIKSKSEVTTVPFSTGHHIPLLFTSDTTGNLVYWKHTDEPTELIMDNFHIHSNQIDSIAISEDDTLLCTMSGLDSIVCQWEIKPMLDKSPTRHPESALSVEKYSIMEQSANISQYVHEAPEPAKEILHETTVLVRHSKIKLLSHVLTSEKSSELKSELTRPPNAFLTLEHVFGINATGKICYFEGNNGTNSGREITYNVSKYVVNENAEKRTQKIYEGHCCKVTCFAISNNIVASADISNNVHFWNPANKELLKVMKLPFDSGITSLLEFSSDGELLLAVASGKQTLTVLNWEQDREISYKNLSNEITILDAKFDPTNNDKIICIGGSSVIVLELNSGSLVTTNLITPPFDNPKTSLLLCMDFLAYTLGELKPQTDVYIGTSGGEIGVFIDNQFEKLTTEPIHIGAINCIKITTKLHSPACIITAGDDNFVKLWDLSLNLICSINIPALDLYKTSPMKGSGIPLSYLNGVHSLDLSIFGENKFSILTGLRCGDVIETELEYESSQVDKSMQDIQTITRRISKAMPKCTLLSRNHSSFGQSEECKVCIAPIPGTTFMLSSGDDCTLRLWDLSTNLLVWIEDLGVAREMKVSALTISPTGELLAIGFRSGKIIYYGFITGANQPPKIVMRYTTHDSIGGVLCIKFSEDAELLAISHNFAVPGEDEERKKEMSSGVFIYTKSSVTQQMKRTSKELYTKIKWIDIPISISKGPNVSRSPVSLKFSNDNKYLQLCYLSTTRYGKIVYEKDPTCIVWDLERDAVVEDWDQLKHSTWKGLAFSPAIFARTLSGSADITFSTLNLLGTEPHSLVCAGSATGDLHLFRYAALLVDKKELAVKSVQSKTQMALAKSWNSCCSYIDSVHFAKYKNSQWILATSVQDETIIKYTLTYEDDKWNLDYLLLNPSLVLEDPFQEFPSKEKFFLLLNERWSARSAIGNSLAGKSETQTALNFQVSWVFGRRAFDRRNNLKFDYLRRIVYPAGTMLIIVNENAQHFVAGGPAEKGKKKPVQQIILNSASEDNVYPEISCIAMSKSKHIVAIGTAEVQAHIYAWDISTDAEISVTPIRSASLIYTLKIHRNERHAVALALSTEYQQIVLIADLLEGTEVCRATQIHSLAFKIRDIEFSPGETYTDFVTCGIQHVSFWQKCAKYITQMSTDLHVPSDASIHFTKPEEDNRTSAAISMSQSILSPQPRQCGALMFCKDIELLEDTKTAFATFLALGFIGQTMITVSDDGCVYLWEDRKIVRKRQGHSGPILCLDIRENDRLVVTGGLDGRVILWTFNERTTYRKTDLEKIRSIHVKSDGLEKAVQSVCIDRGILMVGTKTGSIHLLNVADDKGNIKPKQSDSEGFKPFLHGVDHETPQSVAFDPLNNRLCYLSKKGLFAVLNIETQLLVHVRNYNAVGKAVHLFRTTGDVLLAFENEVILLTGKYSEIPGVRLVKKNITAVKISNNDTILVVANMESGAAKVTVYEMHNGFRELFTTKGYKSAVVTIDFTSDDNYLFAGDELGENFLYEVDQLLPLKSDASMEVELEWQSWGLKTDPYFHNIGKYYSHTNKVSAVTRIQYKNGSSVVAVGDQAGSLKVYKYPMSSAEGCLIAKFEHLVWVGQCIANKEGTMLWTFAEGDRCAIKWKITGQDKIKGDA